MRPNRIPTIAIVILALAFPLAVLADVTGTPTLAAGTALSLDTGATSSSGGDILWSGTSITPQGNATAGTVTGLSGASTYSALTQQTLSAFAALMSKSAIPVSSLTVNAIVVVKTNGGNYAKILVTAQSGTSITLQFQTYGASSTPSGPTITQILNNYGLIPPGFSNSGIAQGSLFIVKGSGLSDPKGDQTLQSSANGLKTTLNGTTVKITAAGGTTVTPVFYYALPTQLALVLPSNTPVGAATLTVTYNGQTSSAASFQVVQSAMGLDAYYGTGSGLGVATSNATGTLYSYTNSIPPGTIVVLWGSGLGADPQRDTTYVGAAFNINSLAHVYVGGLDATIYYQGASGYPGLNQVVIQIPTTAPTGCNVSVVGVTAAGVPTNFITLPIGNGACSDSTFGVSGSQQQSLSGQTTVKTGSVIVLHSVGPGSTAGSTQTNDLAEAVFQSVSGSSIGSSSGSVSVGGCIVSETAGSGGSTATTTPMDAGTITMTGPVGGTVTLQQAPTSLGLGIYYAQLASGAIPSSGGTFTFKGTGGTTSPAVGAFTASVVLPNPILNWTNQSAAASVTRSQGLPIQWTGGAAGTYVLMSGYSSGTVSGQQVSGSYTCIAPVSAGSFTVPSYVLSVLPAGTGSTSVSGYTNYQSFTAPNLDIGTAFGATQQSVNSTVN